MENKNEPTMGLIKIGIPNEVFRKRDIATGETHLMVCNREDVSTKKGLVPSTFNARAVSTRMPRYYQENNDELSLAFQCAILTLEREAGKYEQNK